MEMGRIALIIFPFLLIAALLEAWLLISRKKVAYNWKATAASIGIAVGQRLINGLFAGMSLGVFLMAAKHSLWTIQIDSVWSYIGLFFAVEFAYYWHHRFSHECRWFWANHSVHHSPQQFYLSGAYRLGWTGQLTGHFLFYLPLALIGFPPVAIFLTLAVNLIFQFWLHTELIGKLGWFDRAFNSPSNHRVHHGTNTQYLDRNYGGVLMLFDHLFGTYQAELDNEVPQYGLIKQIRSNNPVRIAFSEWLAIAKDLRSAKNLREVAGYLFAPPGWKPHGQSVTSKDLRKAKVLSAHSAHSA
jgi:sterol desaturase/sphingolipid hydroxylase (fatty acid hydroxylase superfamily)